MTHSRRGGLVATGLACALATSLALADPPAPRKVIAVLDANQTIGNSNTRRSVSFYDATELDGGGTLNQSPLFSVWLGYEISAQLNFEEVETIAVNPANGTVYVASFDSGSVGTPDLVGDTQGDLDLYRIDYQSILRDWETNNRPRGTMYAPTVSSDGQSNVDHPDHVGSTIFLDSAVSKIGEVARAQATNFFDRDLEFVNPATLLMLDNEEPGNDLVANDHTLRILNRVSTNAGQATAHGQNEGGFNGNTTQSWESNIAALLDMDSGTGRSEPTDMALVKRDGVTGVWVAESDGGGDDISFFEIDLSTGNAAKKEFRVGSAPYTDRFVLDDDPVVDPTTNDGTADWVLADRQGNLLIGESGFFDVGTVPGGQQGAGGQSGAAEPKVIGREVLSYDGADTDFNGLNEVVFGPWSVSSNLPVPTSDDDAAVTDGRFVTIDKGTGEIYYFDIDSGVPPDVRGDVYVFDPATGDFVYEEQNALQGFLKRHGVRLFLRGDMNDDGIVDADDIDLLFSYIADPTIDGTVSSALGQEWFDLTGDIKLSGVINSPNPDSDIDELVQRVLQTAYGDANLDGRVSIADFADLQNSFGSTGGWAAGDFNGDATVSIGDFALLQNNFGFDNTTALAATELLANPAAEVMPTPEPATLVSLVIGTLTALVGGYFTRRRRPATQA